MEVEANMQASNFIYRFGFKSGLPIQFNTLRHTSGISPWDDPTPFAQDPIPDDLVNFNLHWHQLAGVHSIVRSIFTEKPDATHTTGVLIGDEVGLGKTAQAVTLIAFLNQSILGTNRVPPRVLRKLHCYKYLVFPTNQPPLTQNLALILERATKYHRYLISFSVRARSLPNGWQNSDSFSSQKALTYSSTMAGTGTFFGAQLEVFVNQIRNSTIALLSQAIRYVLIQTSPSCGPKSNPPD